MNNLQNTPSPSKGFVRQEVFDELVYEYAQLHQQIIRLREGNAWALLVELNKLRNRERDLMAKNQELVASYSEADQEAKRWREAFMDGVRAHEAGRS